MCVLVCDDGTPVVESAFDDSIRIELLLPSPMVVGGEALLFETVVFMHGVAQSLNISSLLVLAPRAFRTRKKALGYRTHWSPESEA